MDCIAVAVSELDVIRRYCCKGGILACINVAKSYDMLVCPDIAPTIVCSIIILDTSDSASAAQQIMA
jgi:hypothetical protein